MFNYFGQVDFIKGEAERQRLQREELETELCALKEQMQNLRNADDDTKRFRPITLYNRHANLLGWSLIYIYFL